MKIIFIGTPKFASIILTRLIENKYKPVLAITALDKPVGRKQILTPSEVKLTCQKYKIPIIQPKKIKDSTSEIKKLNPDLIVLTAYGQIVPKDILDIAKYGAINIHPSLLPKYRGASPIQNTILNGDKKTGITIYLMDEKMDHGSILFNIEYLVPDKIYCEELLNNLAELGAKLLMDALPKIENKDIKPKKQDEKKATYTKIINKEDGHIGWKKPAEEIERHIRAFHIWPGSFTFWEKNDKMLRIKILKAEVKKLSDNDYPFGKAVASPENELLIICRDNALSVLELQLEGKKPMSSTEFLKGYPDIIGAILK